MTQQQSKDSQQQKKSTQEQKQDIKNAEYIAHINQPNHPNT
ncbi:MAG: hypothetical protein K0R78_1260 [Pelosinus sp.]|jgi:hypothetical protein|nr:hypothetical protein [Pelosinus sp.]